MIKTLLSLIDEAVMFNGTDGASKSAGGSSNVEITNALLSSETLPAASNAFTV